MAIEDVKRLYTVNDPTQAQRLLNEGRNILAVCIEQDEFDQFAEYQLGHARAEKYLRWICTRKD